MEDSPEDLPKPQPPRRTAARPFFSPRTNSGEGTTGPLELIRRRAAQLFTPPGSSPATPIADRVAPHKPFQADAEQEIDTSSAADGASGMIADATEMEADDARASATTPDAIEKQDDIEFEGDWTAPPLITTERTLDADSLRAHSNIDDDDRLVFEQFEHEDIELNAAASSATDEHSIEVIEYVDANSQLKAAANDGENPEVDGLTLEATEFSFEQAPPPPRMNVDSFWATEPFAAARVPVKPAASEQVADETESSIDGATAGEAEVEMVQSANDSLMDEEALEWADDPSTTIAHAQAAVEPEPEHDPQPVPQPAPLIADIAPPWMSRVTPLSSPTLEQLKESEPWDLTPSQSHEAIPAALVEPVAPVAPVAPVTQVDAAGHDVADALERIAARVRAGELDVPYGAHLSDEATLSAVLTALLRHRR